MDRAIHRNPFSSENSGFIYAWSMTCKNEQQNLWITCTSLKAKFKLFHFSIVNGSIFLKLSRDHIKDKIMNWTTFFAYTSTITAFPTCSSQMLPIGPAAIPKTCGLLPWETAIGHGSNYYSIIIPALISNKRKSVKYLVISHSNLQPHYS